MNNIDVLNMIDAIELIAIAEKSEIMQSISNDNLDIIYSELL